MKVQADAHLIVQAVQDLLENALRDSEGDIIFGTEVRGRDLH